MIAGFIGTVFEQIKGFVIGLKYTASDLAYFNRGEQVPALIYNNVNVTFESVLFSAISKLQDNKETVKQEVIEQTYNRSITSLTLYYGVYPVKVWILTMA